MKKFLFDGQPNGIFLFTIIENILFQRTVERIPVSTKKLFALANPLLTGEKSKKRYRKRFVSTCYKLQTGWSFI